MNMSTHAAPTKLVTNLHITECFLKFSYFIFPLPNLPMTFVLSKSEPNTNAQASQWDQLLSYQVLISTLVFLQFFH